ncbi:Major facilitator superfamily transporter [Tolypocladium paradoxum]|uniref:Major facilitator superfamily transporter n=1 Tax=Tolypocladium paradoxum TaxID=94208 RepID=A0A2S4LBF7_9HYPO|nr:Major facilitator superfamily transporter [Tolypocladium paradoxum]
MAGDEITQAQAANAHFDAEKQNVENLEDVDPGAQGAQPFHIDPGRRVIVEKQLKRKLDARCALFVLIYIMNYLDRNNIAAARLKGLQDDLKLDNTQYATCLSILYVGYILMQVPSNILINRIQRPSLYIACAMLLWGLISTLSGNANNFAGMVTIRFFLGFIEAAFLPGALLILSKWYTRRELTTRNAILFCGNLISNAFSALVGAGVLSNMQGVLGHAAWRWLFWIEGAITMAVAMSAAFILPDLPHNARGFTEEERLVAQLRMFEDVGEADKDAADQGAFDGLLMALSDVKIYVMMLTSTAYVVGLSFNAFFVSLSWFQLRLNGHTDSTTAHPHRHSWLRLRSYTVDELPPVGLLVPGVHSRFLACRPDSGKGQCGQLSMESSKANSTLQFWHIVGPILMGVLGFVMSMSTLNVAARYIALFLQAGSYAGFIVFYSWISSSFPRPPAKRAVAIAMINAFSQLGNVAGSYIWNLKDNGYRKSYGIVLSMFGVTIAGCWAFRMMLNNLNKKLEESEVHEVAEQRPEGDSIDNNDESLQMRKGFRYLV